MICSSCLWKYNREPDENYMIQQIACGFGYENNLRLHERGRFSCPNYVHFRAKEIKKLPSMRLLCRRIQRKILPENLAVRVSLKVLGKVNCREIKGIIQMISDGNFSIRNIRVLKREIKKYFDGLPYEDVRRALVILWRVSKGKKAVVVSRRPVYEYKFDIITRKVSRVFKEWEEYYS